MRLLRASGEGRTSKCVIRNHTMANTAAAAPRAREDACPDQLRWMAHAPRHRDLFKTGNLRYEGTEANRIHQEVEKFACFKFRHCGHQ